MSELDDLPIVTGTERPDAIDISALRSISGRVTYDPGLANTAMTKSAISYIDGERSTLRYRGINIEELAAQSSFLETAFLLIHGDLPAQSVLESFVENIRIHTLLREDMRPLFDAFPRDAHPMAILGAATTALSTFYQDHYDPLSADDVEVNTYRLIAKLPTVAAFAYKRSIGQPYIYPRNDLDYASNFLHMMFAVPPEPYFVSPAWSRALDTLLLLHADHGQNCSTTTVRIAGSSRVNVFGAMAAGISALWGPLHGGANQSVVEMLQAIQASGASLDSVLSRAKDPHDSFRLSGFGHRVYRSYDPRAMVVKGIAHEIVAERSGGDPLIDIALTLEQAVLEDSYFVERNLYPNVDFYSGIVYRAMGIPLDMFPVLFAIGRLPGWIAQWREMMADEQTRIGRPRQVYVGPGQRRYRPIGERTDARAKAGSTRG